MTTKRKLCLFNISGPYAVGKDTLLNALLKRYGDRVYRVRAITTRAVSTDADPSYTQVSPNAFRERIREGRWIATHQLSGRVSYGVSIDEIDLAAKKVAACILSIYASNEGAGKLRELFGDRLLSVGLLAAHGSLEDQLMVLKRRLLMRGRDDAQSIEARLRHQVEPLRYIMENPSVDTSDGTRLVFDKILVNDDLEITVNNLEALFHSAFFK